MDRSAPIPAETAWKAVTSRDRRRDGEFVYAVRTTGVYCRPGCPSRRPRRENVEFFATPAAAARAGYRACARCRPAEAVVPAIATLERARARLDAQLDAPPALRTLARDVGLSPAHLQRTFRSAFGLSPKQYVLERRAARFKTSLRRNARVTDAQYDAGYSAPSRAQAGAVAHFGMPASAYRNGGRGADIHYAFRETEFGVLMVATTPRGLCAVAIGDSAPALESNLEREFPLANRRQVTARRTADDERFLGWIDAILSHLAGRQPRLSVPADVAATAFQRRVWRALQRIPYGETRTYAAVAKSIGQPGSARAVARACATNPLAVVVPCHRVVPATNGPGGYRWGAGRKKRLLNRES
ncbi:MAG TPA: methylated-DNA--[protein]-cysteine S-methyltransferase [Vicinamibacterales bacterium]|nr:methylated-DNA--[protein]-cysteine S-methyltransferase [Vicinamibacterales bacterium]